MERMARVLRYRSAMVATSEATSSNCRAAPSGSTSTRGSTRSRISRGASSRPARTRRSLPSRSGRLLRQADGDRFPDRDATLGQALDKYLEVTDLEVSTREAHQGYIRRTIWPVLGEVKIRKLGADSLDALYTALKKCSRLCGRLPKVEHYAEASTPATSGAGRCATTGPAGRTPATSGAACTVQADEARDHPAHPLHHLRRPGPGRPVRMGRPERRQERHRAAPPQARA